MNLVIISDTHGKHERLELPQGDMLIHAGDISRIGEPKEVIKFLDWFSNQDFKYKIFIAGNHDFYFERATEFEIKNIVPEGVIYLNDSGVEIEGIKIWGSPITPWFHNWAFNRQRGDDINHHWEKIPVDTNILITHGPPHGILDTTSKNERVGCEDLKDKIEELETTLHIFGHIHESYGIHSTERVTYVNASVLNQYGKMRNKAIQLKY